MLTHRFKLGKLILDLALLWSHEEVSMVMMRSIQGSIYDSGIVNTNLQS